MRAVLIFFLLIVSSSAYELEHVEIEREDWAYAVCRIQTLAGGNVLNPDIDINNWPPTGPGNYSGQTDLPADAALDEPNTLNLSYAGAMSKTNAIPKTQVQAGYDHNTQASAITPDRKCYAYSAAWNYATDKIKIAATAEEPEWYVVHFRCIFLVRNPDPNDVTNYLAKLRGAPGSGNDVTATYSWQRQEWDFDGMVTNVTLSSDPVEESVPAPPGQFTQRIYDMYHLVKRNVVWGYKVESGVAPLWFIYGQTSEAKSTGPAVLVSDDVAGAVSLDLISVTPAE